MLSRTAKRFDRMHSGLKSVILCGMATALIMFSLPPSITRVDSEETKQYIRSFRRAARRKTKLLSNYGKTD